MPNKTRTVCLAVAAFLLVCSAAHAQQRWQFMPSLRANVDYQDNVAQVPDESDADRQSDISASLVPSAGLLYSTYYTRALLRFSGAWRFFFLDPDNNNDGFLEDVGADFEYSRWLTPRVQLEWHTNIIYFFSNADVTEGGDVLIPRQESIVTGAGLAFNHQATQHTNLRYEVGFATSEFEEIVTDDFITYNGRVELNRAVGQNYNLLFFGEFRRNLFSSDFDLVRSLFDSGFDGPSEFPWDLQDTGDFDVSTVGAGVVYRITPTLSVTIRGGALLPAHEEEGTYKLSGLDWAQEVAVEKTFDRISLSASYDRDISPTRGLSDQVLNQTVTAQLVGEWAQNLTHTIAAGYGKYDATEGTIDFFRGSTNLHYLFARWIGASIGYEYTNQQSDFGGDSERVTDHRVSLSVSLLPPRPDALRF